MRLPTLRAWPPALPAGEDTYQEFTAGTIPVREVIAHRTGWLVVIEPERGFVRGFDDHLDAVRRGDAPSGNVDYTVTWSGMTGGETRPTVIRLELRIAGLRARPRLLFEGDAMAPLWRLTEGAMLGLVVDPAGRRPSSQLTGVWILGPTPVPAGLRRVLTQAGVPRPGPLPQPPARRRRPRSGKTRARARKRQRRDARRETIEKQTEGDHHA